MDLPRFIKGFLLSFVFLISFFYAISGIELVFDRVGGRGLLQGNISGLVTNNQSEPADFILVKPLDINAKSAISVESNLKGLSSVIFEKNSNLKLSIASLTKLMTAIVVLDNYNLEDSLVVSETADSQDPIKQDVKLGDSVPVENLLEIMLVGSSNKSAYALAEFINKDRFVDLMNKRANEIGMENTFFVDPTGLSPRNVSTANDLVKLTEYILKNYPKISQISKNRELDIPNIGKVTNTDQLLGEVPDVICSKTGYTAAAMGCLLLVVENQKNNDYIINVILGADDRFSEMKKLVNWCN